MTVTHDEYLALNSLARDGYKPQRKIDQFILLRSKRWIQPTHDLEWAINEEVDWELSSAGRLEHNLYEKIMRYSDGYRRK